MVEELKPSEIDKEGLPNLDNLKTAEPKVSFDAKKYDGNKVKIATVEPDFIESHWINGELKSNETTKVPAVKITTEIVDTVVINDVKTEIKVSQRFPLQKQDGEWIISKHPKAKLWKFMRKMGVDDVKELKGKLVTLTAEPSKDPNDDRFWLRIVC